ncbi:MAG: IS200/IS605 family transposase [Saprospiraceae bacterium]
MANIMANTFTQLYVQVVFTPKGRENLILQSFEERLYQYITGIVQNEGQKMIAINGMPDHVHLFIGFKPTIAIAELVQKVKASSSKFINEQKWLSGKFVWQEGYGAFTYAHSQLDAVAKYVMNQKEHHQRKTFEEEYRDFLAKFDVPFDERYLFEFYE